ncbi:MAG: 3-dehydroquinate synthase [Saprospiraceae bacterium]|nr:3-dehydroquinate synthase [Saprospiraceae bacterium]
MLSPTFYLQNAPVYLGALSDFFYDWLGQNSFSQIFILTDENTRRHCLPVFFAQTGLETRAIVHEIPSGEAEKNLATCEKIWSAMAAAGLDRQALVVNLGGGVIGDMGGFCAAVWKRGLNFIQVPTTLLAMTDAAIGGKTGVDFQGGKNLLGVFRQPAAVFVDPVFLHSLPEREWRSGFAEILKHAVIAGQSFETMEMADMTALLHRSIAVKVRIVEEDPTERGLRMLLNFGHTIGHAVESYFLATPASLTHGEAVAIGMICESHLAGLPAADTLASFIMRHFLPCPMPESAFPAIWQWMKQDKKNTSDTVRMAVPDVLPYSLKIMEPTRAQVENSLRFYNRLA